MNLEYLGAGCRWVSIVKRWTPSWRS